MKARRETRRGGLHSSHFVLKAPAYETSARKELQKQNATLPEFFLEAQETSQVL